VAHAQQSYIPSKEVFANIENVKLRAESHAVCAAIFTLGQRLEKKGSPKMERYRSLIEGARKSIIMTLLGNVDFIADGRDEYNSVFNEAQESSFRWPSNQLESILTDRRVAGPLGEADWMKRVQVSLNICTGNVKDQIVLGKRLDALINLQQ
jgi:hypothetical protein